MVPAAAATSSRPSPSPISVTNSPRRTAPAAVGDVDRHQVHRDRARRSGSACRRRWQRRPASRRSTPAAREIAIGIADRRPRRCGWRAARSSRRCSRRSRPSPRCAPAAMRALQFDHRPHRIGLARRRVGAVERDARAHQVAMRVVAEKNAGRIGQRRRDAAKEHAHFAEQPDLLIVERVRRVFGAGEVAHQQA